MSSLRTPIAACVFELDAQDGAPTEAHLLPVGPFRAVDGRPVECEAWQLDAAIAARVIALARSRQTDICIFHGHQDLWTSKNGQPALAAGWCPRSMEWREGRGLYVTGITWVGDTADLIQQKKLRYVSALFAYSPESGEVLEIISIALTNTPALDGLDALADLARSLTTLQEDDMADDAKTTAALTAERDELKTNLAALTAERDGLSTKLAALTAERDKLQTSVAALESEKAAATAVAEKEKHTVLLAAALSDGRLTPAQKPWAEKQSLGALTEYLDATTPLGIAGKRQSAGHGGAGEQGLTNAELAMCERMGVTPEDFQKARA